MKAYGRMDEWTNGRMDEWMDGWMDGWMNSWLIGWEDVCCWFWGPMIGPRNQRQPTSQPIPSTNTRFASGSRYFGDFSQQGPKSMDWTVQISIDTFRDHGTGSG
jgi:hypothetical protein